MPEPLRKDLTKAEAAKELKVADIPFHVPTPVPSVYCNQAIITGTNWDIRFGFAEIVVLGDKAVSELRTTVVMSHAHAKVFAEVVTAWFKENGELFKK
jgi:hypothetical protein